MPSRAELVARANVVGIDTTTLKMANDSVLEQRILQNEKFATAFTGTISTTTLTSDTTTVADGDTLTFTVPSSTGVTTRVYTYKTTLTETAATGTLTSDTTTPSDGDMVTIGGMTYVFRTTLNTASTAGEVLINGSAANALTNLSRAIGLTGTPGTDYASVTKINNDVNLTSVGSTTLVVTAKAVGVYGNSIATTETSTHLSWGGSFLASGADPVANQVLIGVSAATNLSNLKLAINGSATAGVNYSSTTPPSKHLVASTLTASTLVINSSEFAIANGDIGTVFASAGSAHLSFTGSTLASGVAKVIAAVTTGAGNRDNISGNAETLY